MKKVNKLGAGIGIGTAVGFATDNLGLWIGFDVAIGDGVGNALTRRADKKDDTKS
jgi:hypothetical protein